MAFIVERPNDHYELRENEVWLGGRRSRTLVAFRVLNDQVLDLAAQRAKRPFDREQLIRNAQQMGIMTSSVDVLCKQLFESLAAGNRPTPIIGQALSAELAKVSGEPSAEVAELGRWVIPNSKESIALGVELSEIGRSIGV